MEVEEKQANHWRLAREGLEPDSGEWLSCDAMERAVSAQALVDKYRKTRTAGEEKQGKEIEQESKPGGRNRAIRCPGGR